MLTLSKFPLDKCSLTMSLEVLYAHAIHYKTVLGSHEEGKKHVCVFFCVAIEQQP